MTIEWLVVAGLIGWATLAGLDLASLLQALLSRPLVVGAGAGWLLGDPENGLRVGALLEMFALDVVPVGSSGYPDFGAATVAAVMVAGTGPWQETLGIATGFGLGLASLAGATLPMTRRLNARTLRANAERLTGGDDQAVERVHWAGLGHDAVRSLVVGVVAVAVAYAVRRAGWVATGDTGIALTVVAIGGAGWAVAHGATTSARSGHRWRWALAGVGTGLAVVLTW